MTVMEFVVLGVMRVYVFRVLAILHLLLGVMYLVWRVSQGLAGTLWISIPFLVAELFVWLATASFSISHLPMPVTRSLQDYPALENQLPDMPYVDVVILRRWDSPEITEDTARAALAIHYPWHRLFVYILDIEPDPEMKQVVAALPCDYLSCTSTTTDPLHYLLREVTTFGEFILILEPGQLPDPDLLHQTLPYFYTALTPEVESNNTGFVQVMLRAYGHPILDHPLQQLIPVNQDGSSVAPLLGTGSLLRREALQGVDNLDIRRPVALGTQMHRQGWTSYLCREAEVGGVLLPLRNRLSALLALLDGLKLNPIFGGQTSQLQRFQYLWLGVWSLSGLAYLMYFLIPILFLSVGLAPVPSFDRAFLSWFLPYVLVGRIAWVAAFQRVGLWAAWHGERQAGAQFFQSIQALIQSLQGIRPYTEKPTQLSLGPQALIALVTLLSIVVGSIRLARGWEVGVSAFIFGLAWALYNLVLLVSRPPGFEFILDDTESESD